MKKMFEIPEINVEVIRVETICAGDNYTSFEDEL